MTRFAALVVLSVGGLLLAPLTASAQLSVPLVRPFGLPNVPSFVPTTNPFFYVPQYRYTSSMQFVGPPVIGNIGFGTTRTYVGTAHPAAIAYAVQQPYPYYYWGGGSFMSGSPNARGDLVIAAQRNLQRAQLEASLGVGRTPLTGPSNLDVGKGGAVPIAPPLNIPDPIRIAVNGDRALIVSGDAMNTLLKEIVRLEAKGAKGPAGYVSPLLFDDIHFAGTPNSDLFDLARRPKALGFPAAFNAPALKEPRLTLAKDFAVVAVSVQAGQSPNKEKLAKLEISFQELRTLAEPILKDLPPADATAPRRFLNRMDNAIKALQAGAATGLVDPNWKVEGLTVAELAKHMERHKLQFGPAPRGSEESYVNMHRNLATYLFVLQQAKK